MRDASLQEEQQFREAIEHRDATELNRLVTEQHPDVLWGRITKTLSEEDNQWAASKLWRD